MNEQPGLTEDQILDRVEFKAIRQKTTKKDKLRMKQGQQPK
jgi:hypothetical protein